MCPTWWKSLHRDTRPQTACGVIPKESNVLYVPYAVEIFYLKMFLTTNQIFAGRSARRRMYHGNQYSP